MLLDLYLNISFKSDFFHTKKINHFEKKIFSFDKANKFHDDMKIKLLILNNIKILLKSNNLSEISPTYWEEFDKKILLENVITELDFQ